MNVREEGQLNDESARGARARKLLDAQPFKDAIAAVKAGIVQRWETSPVRDTEGQHELRLMRKLLDDLLKHIADAADTGKMAEMQLAHERSLRQRAQAAIHAFRR
jgi:hypothetical protein